MAQSGDWFMRVMQVNTADQGPVLVPVELQKPEAGLGEILVHVHAVGVTRTELLWYPTTHTKSGTARVRTVPGHEFSGIITAIGKDVQDFAVGDEVYGMNDWFADGATAEFCTALPQDIAPKPTTLSHAAAASVPIGALASWQGLIDRAKLEPGERVLIHGGAGAVGLYAVQLAHIHVPASSLPSQLKTSISSSGSERTRRLTIRPPGLKKWFGMWMSSSTPSAATRLSGHVISSSQADAWSPLLRTVKAQPTSE
jgi:D-arabinose 1-dehydrogenase-like Zn-dependent alcohol dehydrogenase